MKAISFKVLAIKDAQHKVMAEITPEAAFSSDRGYDFLEKKAVKHQLLW